MDEMEANGSFDDSAKLMHLLAGIEQQSRASGLGLPETEVHASIWDGLAYSITGVRVVTGMKEVTEMLTYPESITPVPGAKKWMLGLANVRGSLLPVVDLQLYLGGKAVVASKMARMLVLKMRGLVVGVLVPSVQGMRHFDEENRMLNARMKGALGAYVFEAYSVDGDIWPVFSLSALAADPVFRVAVA